MSSTDLDLCSECKNIIFDATVYAFICTDCGLEHDPNKNERVREAFHFDTQDDYNPSSSKRFVAQNDKLNVFDTYIQTLEFEHSSQGFQPLFNIEQQIKILEMYAVLYKRDEEISRNIPQKKLPKKNFILHYICRTLGYDVELTNIFYTNKKIEQRMLNRLDELLNLKINNFY